MIQKLWDILGTQKIYIYKSSVYLQSNKMSQLKYQIFLGPWIQQSQNKRTPVSNHRNSRCLNRLNHWLVVLTILKNMKVNGEDYPIYSGK